MDPFVKLITTQLSLSPVCPFVVPVEYRFFQFVRSKRLEHEVRSRPEATSRLASDELVTDCLVDVRG